MTFLAFLAGTVALNLWMTRRVLRAGDQLDHKGLLVAGIWLMPGMGAFIARNQIRARVPEAGASDTPAGSAAGDVGAEPAPAQLSAPGAAAFPLGDHIASTNGFPVLDWQAVSDWLASIADPQSRQRARDASRRAWLLHLRDAMGTDFRLHESDHALVLSSLEPKVAAAAADYIAKTRSRVGRVLNRLAALPPGERSILLVMDDEAMYYQYVAGYYPDEGEFALSGGMFVNAGCPHFIVKRADLTQVEPVIAHELTHSAVSHLQLPLWLDEGIAVNTEHKLAGAQPGLYTPQEMRARHLRFWGEEEIQQFWSGDSFHRSDEGNMLSYDLARIMVDQMARSWDRFEGFALNARREDAGAASARQHLDLDLGAWVCTLLEKPPSPGWAPPGSGAPAG
jgi:hypothetical protein